MKLILVFLFTSIFAQWQELEVMKLRPGKGFHGPNCWNSALYGSSLAHRIRFSSKYEFHHLMESPYCQKVDRPQKGSIRIYRADLEGLQGPARELHAAIWLDQNTLFNKMTALSTSTHLEQTIEDVDQVYGELSPIIRINVLSESGNQVFRCIEQPCLNVIEHYQCDSLLTIEADIKRKDFFRIYNQIRVVEGNIAEIVSQDYLPEEETVADHLKQIQLLKVKIEQLPPYSHLEQWQIQYFKSLLISLKEQLEMNQPNWLKKD